jgi:hypothetical protein
MNPLDDLLDAEGAPVDDGIMLMTELVAAVSWLRRGAMPGITVWDVVEQALRWRSGMETDWNEPDPLRAALQVTVTDHNTPLPHLLSDAVRSWLAATSQSFNEGANW